MGHQESAGTAVEKATRTLELVRKGKGGAGRLGIFEEGLRDNMKWMKERLDGGGGTENGIKGTCCVKTLTRQHACRTRPWPDHCCLSYVSLNPFPRAPPCNLTVQPTWVNPVVFVHRVRKPLEPQGCYQQQLLLTAPDNSSVVSDFPPTSFTSSHCVLPSNLQTHAYKTSCTCGRREISSHPNISWH